MIELQAAGAAPSSAEPSPPVGGRVVVIGTPIGNLGDLSPRAAEALGTCDILACEDTRRTGRLLELTGTARPALVRLDQHTERAIAPSLLQRVVGDGMTLGLVSDAGMPGLSDPGAVLIELAIEAGIDIEVVPGPFAGVVGLVMSGLLGGDARFVFEGFLPRRQGARIRRLAELADEQRLLVFYESPHRISEVVAQMVDVFGPGRRAAAIRELTKLHEQALRGTLADILDELGRHPPRGEWVLVVEGCAPPGPPSEQALIDAYRDLTGSGMSSRDAFARVAERFGVSTNTVRRLAFSKG